MTPKDNRLSAMQWKRTEATKEVGRLADITTLAKERNRAGRLHEPMNSLPGASFTDSIVALIRIAHVPPGLIALLIP